MRYVLWILVVAACGDDGGGGGGGGPDGGGGGGDSGGGGTVAGKMSFVLGGTAPTPMMLRAASGATLAAGDEYIVSPRKAKITFASVEFRDQSGNKLGGGDVPFTNCVVTYDRSLASGATLLDCALMMPVGDVFMLGINFNKAMEILVSDTTAGIYSDPSVASGYSTTEPTGGAAFVPYTIMIGDSSPTRGAQVILNEPVTIAEGSTPQLYITTDMVQTFQMAVNSDGTTLTAKPGNDPVALFAGLSAGSSRFYSNANSIESYKVGSINGFHSLRIFFDAADMPLFLMSPLTCGGSGPLGAWASPPIGATIGGWLGKDSANNVAWALPLTNTYETYRAYFVMTDTNTLGSNVTLDCKATATPPPPTDGKTYASGAPAMPTPDVQTPLTLLTN
jgi:hypothetical protein